MNKNFKLAIRIPKFALAIRGWAANGMDPHIFAVHYWGNNFHKFPINFKVECCLIMEIRNCNPFQFPSCKIFPQAIRNKIATTNSSSSSEGGWKNIFKSQQFKNSLGRYSLNEKNMGEAKSKKSKKPLRIRFFLMVLFVLIDLPNWT